MKTLLATLVLLVSLLPMAIAATPEPIRVVSDSATYKLTVVISEVNKRTGKLYVGLANNENTFKNASIKTKAVDVPASGEIPVTFEGLAPGRYAVRIYQDLNNNQKMDFEGQMPAEPFGFSTITMLMGPPTFDECAFELNADKTVQVRMIEM